MQRMPTVDWVWWSRALVPSIARPHLPYLLLMGVKSLVYEIPVNIAEKLVSRIAPGKSGTRPVVLLKFDLQCLGYVRLESGPGIEISNTYFDDNRCLFNVLFLDFNL
ncbi:hypothetical protein NPIL_627381 [Nephila pilipes]|uniref:Uncharacterized protein n=1 Tax=Nephila pilipes TaxID=299642 RepID=A0A8X6N698_NEPPI|nr:hypothetical protein NPIL_627381 [Nephila pilipes]